MGCVYCLDLNWLVGWLVGLEFCDGLMKDFSKEKKKKRSHAVCQRASQLRDTN